MKKEYSVHSMQYRKYKFWKSKLPVDRRFCLVSVVLNNDNRPNPTVEFWSSLLMLLSNQLAARCFYGDIGTAVQCPLAAEGRPSNKQHQANQSISSQLCLKWRIADSWLLFNLKVMPLSEKVKVAWPQRAATLKWQAMITQRSDNMASGKLVWNQP